MMFLKIQPRSETGVTPFCSQVSSDISLGMEFLLCKINRSSFTYVKTLTVKVWRSLLCFQDGTLRSANMVSSPHNLS
jgi:hypothetical protein